MVVALVGILAALLLPALAATKERSRQTVCLSDLKQLGLGAQMYQPDNAAKLAANFPSGHGTNSWVLGNLMIPADSTNGLLISQGLLFPYAPQPSVYRCPGDSSQTRGILRVRSYSMNGWMGSRLLAPGSSGGSPQEKRFRTFVKDNELAAAGPASLWLICEEHEASIDDGWFLVTMNDSEPFASFPATRHQRAFYLNYADGHVEKFRLHDPTTQAPGMQVGRGNTDWIRLKQITTCSWGL